MIRGRERIGSAVLGVEEAFSRLPYKPARTLVDKVVGSDAPAYQQLLWRTAKQSLDEIKAAAWSEWSGDNGAHGLPRSRSNAVILEAFRSEIVQLRRKAGLNHGRPAIAYEAYDKLHVGTLPLKHEFVAPPESGGSTLVVGMRIGPGALRACMGYWDNQNQLFFAATQVEPARDMISLYEAPLKYPRITIG